MPYLPRPNFRARHHAVCAGHYLAAMAAHDLLREGANAADAAAAAAFCLTVLEPHQNGLGGECPVLLHFKGKTVAVSGQGVSPRSLTLEWFRERGVKLIPGDGLLPATVPSHVGTWIHILREYGTMPLGRVLEPAIDLAETGFHIHAGLAEAISGHQERFLSEWPTSAEVFLMDGKAPVKGALLKRPALGETFRRLKNEAARKTDRIQGLQAAYDWFYRGPAAAAMEDFCSRNQFRDDSGLENPGFLTRDDLRTWRPQTGKPVTYDYRGVEVAKCGPWTQGPVFLQQLSLLQQFPVSQMKRRSAPLLHLIIEAAKLAFADREAWYGDPDFDDVPLDALLSERYARRRAELINPERASEGLIPGDPYERRPVPDVSIVSPPDARASGPEGHTGDTTHLDVVDRWGNCVSATPSGGWLLSSPVIPELGFPLGTRGQMFYLDPERNNCYRPGKRPRATLTPSIALQDGRPWLVFGTPGGDGQDQWTLQMFLNIVDFGMDPAEALEAPTITVQSFPSSFYPRRSYAQQVSCESRFRPEVLQELERLGHVVDVVPAYSNGKPSLIRLEEDGSLTAAASSRAEVGYAVGW